MVEQTLNGEQIGIVGKVQQKKHFGTEYLIPGIISDNGSPIKKKPSSTTTLSFSSRPRRLSADYYIIQSILETP